MFNVLVNPKTGLRQIVTDNGKVVATMDIATDEATAHLLAAAPAMYSAIGKRPATVGFECCIAKAEGKELLVRMLESG